MGENFRIIPTSEKRKAAQRNPGGSEWCMQFDGYFLFLLERKKGREGWWKRH